MTDYVVAEAADITLDGEGASKDGEHEGKSCPFKDKTASIELLPNI